MYIICPFTAKHSFLFVKSQRPFLNQFLCNAKDKQLLRLICLHMFVFQRTNNNFCMFSHAYRPILRSFLRNLCSRVHVCRPLWPCYAFLMSGLKWAEESISAYSWLFHAVAWTLPAAKTTFIIALGLVEVRNNRVNRYRRLTKVNS